MKRKLIFGLMMCLAFSTPMLAQNSNTENKIEVHTIITENEPCLLPLDGTPLQVAVISGTISIQDKPFDKEVHERIEFITDEYGERMNFDTLMCINFIAINESLPRGGGRANYDNNTHTYKKELPLHYDYEIEAAIVIDGVYYSDKHIIKDLSGPITLNFNLKPANKEDSLHKKIVDIEKEELKRLEQQGLIKKKK